MPIPAAARDQFKTYLDAARADATWQQEIQAVHEKRRAVVPALRQHLEQLRTGAISLQVFKDTFDQKTRKEWEGFGLKGMSGAMFLNQIVLHVPESAAPRSHLLDALRLPADLAAARDQMSAFLAFLDTTMREHGIPKMKLQPGRTPFFLSAWWHLQDPERWPVYYESARWALAEMELFAETGDPLRDYGALHQAWFEVARDFQLTSWDLESVLSHAHLAPERKVPAIPASTAPAPEPARPAPTRAAAAESEDGPSHAEVQAMLAQIGEKLGLKVWIASNDQGRQWNGQRLGAMSIPELPNLGIGEDAQKIVNLIDVLWLRKTNQIVAAFEIECTTSIYSGLLRMSDLNATCPNLSFPCYIALPTVRIPEVIRQLSRATFQTLGLHERCGYFATEDLKTDFAAILKWSRNPDCIQELSKWVEDVR